MRTVFSRLAAFFRRDPLDRELDEEVQFHLEMLTQEHLRRGMSARDARAAALRTFGGVIQMKETYRDQRGLPFIETLAQDVRYGARTLLRSPGFTFAALLTLALGIGANSAIFSVVNAVLLKPLPYPEPDRIVEMYRDGAWNRHSNRRFQHYKAHMTSFDGFAAWTPTAFNLVAGDHAEFVQALQVSEDYFRVMGTPPVYGHTFRPEDDVPNGPKVAVLRQSLWKRMFGSSPSAVGQTLLLADTTYTIVGVMPEGFDPARDVELYVPLQPSDRGPGGGFNYMITARLKPGITLAQAEQEAAAAFAGYKASQPTQDFGDEIAPRLIPLQDSLARGVKPALLLMLAAVGLLLLIACANTANLLLARASGRTREISVRAALGARRGRIVRQLVTESTLLFTAGGLLGVLLAYWLVPALLALTPPAFLPAQDVRVDSTVLLATLALSLATGVIFGLAPAISLSQPALVEAFKEDGTRTTSTRRSTWMRHALVASEMALCTLLLVAAGLLIQTFVKLRAVDLGFDPANVVTARMSLMGERYATTDAVNRLFERGLDRIRQIPGVQSAAVVNGIPVERGLNLNFDRVETSEREFHLTDWRYATPEYFDAIGIRIVNGRGLQPSDSSGAPKVAVVSEQFARQYYKDTHAIGQRIVIFEKDGPIEIVGIAKDLREAGLSGPVPAVMYVPAAQAGDGAVRAAHTYFQVSWVIKATGVSAAFRQRIQEEFRSVDPHLPITAVRTMDEVKARAMAIETFQMTLLTTFAVTGLLLAAAGVYGLVTYNVSQRTRELGIRLALGASRRQVLLLVLRQAAILAAVGSACGAAVSLMAGRAMQSFVFGVDTADPMTLAIVGTLLMAVALTASLLPALRAVRLDPVTALRE